MTRQEATQPVRHAFAVPFVGTEYPLSPRVYPEPVLNHPILVITNLYFFQYDFRYSVPSVGAHYLT